MKMKTADKTCSIWISALNGVFEVKFAVPFSTQVLIVNVHKALPITKLENRNIFFLILKDPVFHGHVWALSQGKIGSTEVMTLEPRVPVRNPSLHWIYVKKLCGALVLYCMQ